jgi:hypothetical protein
MEAPQSGKPVFKFQKPSGFLAHPVLQGPEKWYKVILQDACETEISRDTDEVTSVK